MTTEANKVTHGFQAEVKQLLHLMIHSLYSNKEIVLRELISNASDAADKLRFAALSNDGLYEGDAELKVRIEFDKNARTLSIIDNGIGMTREEVQDNIGTIAKSGTKEFFSKLSGDEAKDSQLIGQFGWLLFRLHHRRQSHPLHPQSRRARRPGRGVGVQRRRRIHPGIGRTAQARHQSRAAFA